MRGIKWLGRVMILIFLLFSFACKKSEEQKESKTELPPPPPKVSEEVLPSPEVEKVAPAKPEPLPPEKYYQFELEWRKIQKAMQDKYLELVKSAQKFTPELEEKLKSLDQQMADKYGQLKEKYKITYLDLQRTITEPESKKALEKYLAKHPEIKKELDELEQKMSEQKKEYQKELNRLLKGKLPPTEEGCPECEEGEKY